MKTKEVDVKKRFGIQENRVHMGAFDFSVIIVIGDYEKTKKYIAWKFDDEDVDFDSMDKGYEPRGRCFFRSGYVPVIWVPKKPRTAREHATFAHECLHAVFHLFEWAGLPLTRDTEEVMAHAMSHLITNGLNGS